MRLFYSFSQRMIWLITFAISRIFTRAQIISETNMKLLPTPLLIVANHKSYWDPMLIGTMLPFFSKHIPLGFIAADEYFNNPLFALFLFFTGTKPAYKGQGLNISLKYPKEILKRNGVF